MNNKLTKKIILGIICFAILFFVINVSFVFAQNETPSQATLGDNVGGAVAILIGWIANIFFMLTGWILTLLIDVLIKISAYNGFINVTTVEVGWVKVRDLCNMFFILILLIIAFATILRIESYPAKKLLPKLLIMAVLINFSKTICGLFIDFSQVIMLTFVNAFKDAGAGNLINLFKIQNVAKIGTATDAALQKTSATGWMTVIGIILGVIVFIVTIVVVLVMIVILIMRIIMLWIYVILSPLAFLLASFPAGQKYSAQWWGDFSKNVIVGPVLAFFLWLALKTAEQSSVVMVSMVGADPNNQVCAGQGSLAFFCSDEIQKFIIVLGLLVGGLIVTQQIGGIAGKIAGKGMGALQKGQGLIKKGAIGTVKGAGDLGLGVMAGRGRVGTAIRDRLGAIGGSRVPIVNRLATKSLSGLNARQASMNEKAQKMVGNISDARILGRLARNNAITPWGRAVKSAATNKAPSTFVQDHHGNITPETRERTQDLMSSMSRENLQKLNRREFAQLGAAGIVAEAGTEFRDYLESNRVQRGAFNSGVAARNGNINEQIQGRGNNGQLNGDRGDVDPARNLRFDNNYRKAKEEEKDMARGLGNLSIGKFGEGKSNTIAVDLSKLNLESLKEFKDDKFEHIKGVSISDSGKINEVASKMVNILDDEINKLKTDRPESMSDKGFNYKMRELEEAKKRFETPESLKNLNLVNSSSTGYGARDFKKTLVHEEIHGMGYQSEEDVEKATQHIIDNKQYSKRKDKKSIEEILGRENEEEGKKPKSGDEPESNQNPETRTMIAGIINNKSGDFKELAFLLKQLNKTLLSQSGSLDKMGKGLLELSSIDPEKTTPLEIGIVVDEIKSKFKKLEDNNIS
jgi:hypothetical protein